MEFESDMEGIHFEDAVPLRGRWGSIADAPLLGLEPKRTSQSHRSSLYDA